MKTLKDKDVKILGTIGDINPIEYGGGYIIQEGDDIRIEYFYGLRSEHPGMEDPPPDKMFPVYYVNVEEDVFEYHNWVRPDEQKQMAEEMGLSIEEYRLHARSKDHIKRAMVLWDIASHWGWYELDHYPAQFTIAELEKRWDCD